MENNQPAQAQPAPIRTRCAMKDLNSFQKRAIAFLELRHGRVGAQSSWHELPEQILRQICDNLKNSQYCCDFHNFKTLDEHAYEEHMNQHESMSDRELQAYCHFIGIGDYCYLAVGGETETLNGLAQLYSFNP